MAEEKRGVDGGARLQRKRLSEQVVDRLLSDDMLGIPSRLKTEYLEPRLMDLGYDLLIATIGMIFRRDPRGRGSSGGRRDDRYYRDDRDSHRNDYSRYSDTRTPARSNTRPSYDYGTIIFGTRAGAEDALDWLKRTCEQYKQVSVGGLYWKANLTSNRYSDEYWGWTDLSRVTRDDIIPVEDGYSIDLPPVEKIRTR